LIRKSRGRANKRCIDALRIQPCLAKKAFELGTAIRKNVPAGIEYDYDIVSRNIPVLGQTPAFPSETPSSISRDRVGIRTNGNENGPVDRTGVRQDVHPHALAGKPGPRAEDLFYFDAFSDPLVLRKAMPGDLETSCPARPAQYGFFSSEAVSLIRPRALRLFRTRRPPLVFMRARKPNFLVRRVLLG